MPKPHSVGRPLLGNGLRSRRLAWRSSGRVRAFMEKEKVPTSWRAVGGVICAVRWLQLLGEVR